MKKILVINSSARTLHSKSRTLTEMFLKHWKNIDANPTIRFRELGNTDVPHINENWIAAAFKPETARSEAEISALKTSNTYIAELREADVIVLGAPMYNWSIPSALKAYIDQMLRVNETFKVNPGNTRQPYLGLLENKTLFLLLSRGSQGYEKGEHQEHMDFQTTYLRTVFNVMGIRNIHVVAVNGASSGGEQLTEAMTMAEQKISILIENELL